MRDLQCQQWVNSVGSNQAAASPDVCFTSKNGQTGRRFAKSALCQEGTHAPASEHQLAASYLAGRDIAAEIEPSTGSKFDITATDQIRPIATTTAIIHATICTPSTSR